MSDPGALAWQLLRAADWFDTNLRAELVELGYPALNQTDARTFAALVPGTSTPAELARTVGITRQSMQQLLGRLVNERLIRFEPNGDDARSVVVVLDDRGAAMRRDVRRILRRLEKRIATELGETATEALRLAMANAVWTPAATD